jgi:hypothetical protein
VNDAKVALGERGAPWWGVPTDEQRRNRAAATIKALLRHRGAGKSICPSDVARVIGGAHWRDAMDAARAAAAALADSGEIVVTQKQDVVDIRTAKGPVRLRPAISR